MTTGGNPYAAPSGPSLERQPVPYASLKWGFIGALAMVIVLGMLRMGSLGTSMFLGAVIAHLFWVYRTWMMLPREDRMNRSGGMALALLVIPLYQNYWMFVMNLRIEKHLARRLSKSPTRVKSPSFLSWFVPLFFTLVMVVGGFFRVTAVMPLMIVVPILSFVWMYRVDDCFAEIAFQRLVKKHGRDSEDLGELEANVGEA